MTIADAFIQKVAYYRQYDFFADYAHLSDVELAERILLRYKVRSESGLSTSELDQLILEQKLTPDDFHQSAEIFSLSDSLMLDLDNQRVCTLDTGFLFGEEIPPYGFNTVIKNLHELSQISRGIFQPENIHAICEGVIGFQWNHQTYSLAVLGACDDQFSLAHLLNDIVKSTGYQFHFLDCCPDLSIFFLTESEKRTLSETLTSETSEWPAFRDYWLFEDESMSEPCYQGVDGIVLSASDANDVVIRITNEAFHEQEFLVSLDSVSSELRAPNTEVTVVLQYPNFSPSLYYKFLSPNTILGFEEGNCIAILPKQPNLISYLYPHKFTPSSDETTVQQLLETGEYISSIEKSTTVSE